MYEIEERKVIIGFPRYEITNFGRVFNISTGRDMILSPTLQGALTVGLMYGDTQYRRSVKVLVARAFVEGETELFNTPIHLDGDQMNCRASNIVWRPRGFAWEYTHQFIDPPQWIFVRPIVNDKTGETYENIFEACITNGFLFKGFRTSIMNKTRIFPTGDIFSFITQ